MVSTFLVFFLIAGLVSVVESYQETMQTDAENTYAIVLADDEATLMELSSNQNTNPLGEYQEIIDMVTSYRNTIPGQIFGTIKIDDAGLDEFVFDEFFSLQVEKGDFKANIKFRKELQKAAKAIAKIPGAFNGGMSVESIKNLSKEDLKYVIDNLSDLEIIKVVVPVGLEIALLSDKIISEETRRNNPDLASILDQIDVDAIKNIDY